MAIEISRREVLNNLIRFKDSLLEKRERRGHRKKRIYRVLLNKKTGDMRFAKKIIALEPHLEKRRKEGEGKAEDWKEVHLVVEEFPREVRFQALDEEDEPLKASDLEPLAWRITAETISVLNLKAKESKTELSVNLPEETALQDLSSIHLSLMPVENIPGWSGAVDRSLAEKMLMHSLPGVYLIREGDPLTLSVAYQLQEANQMTIQPFLITVAERESKISDILVLRTEKGWTSYLDDPNLSEPDYKYTSTLPTLLQELHLKRPI